MADSAVMAPATHKQPSRKGKKAWRKNVDITQVQTGLEDVRDETIKGGVVSEKTADQLFATDTAGDDQVAKQQNSKKLLKADEILAQRSAVPGLGRRKRKAEEAIIPSSNKKTKNGHYVTHKELQQLKRAANQIGNVTVEEPPPSFDPWADNTKPKDPRFSFLEEKKDKVAPETLKHAPVAQTSSGKALPNVRKPEAGKSYNPLVGDWTALLEREGAAAVEAEKMRLREEAEARDQEARAEAEAAKVEAAEKDAYGTDYESAWESEWEGFQSDGGEQFVAKQQRRKTPAERNKVKARKERAAREKWEQKQKVRDAQEKRIEAIAKESRAKDLAKKGSGKQLLAANEAAAEQSSADEDGVGGEPKLRKTRFGKVAIPDAPLEVTLHDELQDSLRRLKPQGNLLQDRYRNLLVNGKVEARKPVWQRKKAQKFATEKWTYKDFKI